jgi:hypothetical protein
VLACTNAIISYMDTQRAFGPLYSVVDPSFAPLSSIPPWIVKTSLIPPRSSLRLVVVPPLGRRHHWARCPAFSLSIPTQMGSSRNLCSVQICGKNCLWLLANDFRYKHYLGLGPRCDFFTISIRTYCGNSPLFHATFPSKCFAWLPVELYQYPS